jgi:hypothetical protein
MNNMNNKNNNNNTLPPQPSSPIPGWTQLGTTILMGSNVKNPSLAYAGFGPAANDGVHGMLFHPKRSHAAFDL